ncbi:MAG: hypothetical protein ABIC91_01410 [Nanoarchaeota archaeon]|nr:hypothetical protein [Nanoarchaeota archaeon]MBU1029861.1 hypothetical protein [Nanoarchaeota archaeon]MBU1849289.1 hypothetical protein [Nanoarchaeota archaeon]
MIFYDKKGIGLLVKKLITITLSILVLVFVLGFGNNLFASVFGTADKDTMEHFELAGASIELILESEFNFETQRMAFFLDNKYILVGFDKNWDETKTQSNDVNDDDGPVLKPNECYDKNGQEKACICLYNGDIAEKNSKLFTKNLNGNEDEAKDYHIVRNGCKTFEGNIKFISHFNNPQSTKVSWELGSFKGVKRTDIQNPYDPHIKSIDYGYFFLYPYKKTNNFNLYFEKYKNDKDEIFIYVTNEEESNYEQIQERETLLNRCPKTNGLCNDKYVKEIIKDPNNDYYQCILTNQKICAPDQISDCPDGEVRDLCVCENFAVTEGFCDITANEFYTIEENGVRYDCINKITKCENYCLSANDLNPNCEDKAQKTLCLGDICELGCDLSTSIIPLTIPTCIS